MANTYKNIVITPSINSASVDPSIAFQGGNTTANTAVTLRVLPAANGTLSFEGSAGQLFSITNDLSNTLFSVSDISGIPSLEVYANGGVRIAEFSGNVSVGTSNTSAKLYVQGNVTINGSILTTGGISGLTNTVIGANVYLNTEKLFIGNTVANLNANSIIVTIANSTASANHSPLGFVAGITTQNTTTMAVGANAVLSSTRLFVGNSIANGEISGVSFQVINATACTLIVPSSLTLGNTTVNTVANSILLYQTGQPTGAPSVTTRSAGTRHVLYPALAADQVDYATGIESGHVWYSTATLNNGFKWYANTTNIMIANNSGLDLRARNLANVWQIAVQNSAALGSTTITGFVNVSANVIAGGGTVTTVSDGAGGSSYGQIYATTTANLAGVATAAMDGTNNRRSMFFTDNLNSVWGLSTTFSTGGNIPFVMRWADGEKFRIDGNGNTGIGNTAPNAKLHVQGAANISGAVAIGGAGTIGGTLTVTANTTLSANLYVTGTANLTSNSIVFSPTVGTGTVSDTTHNAVLIRPPALAGDHATRSFFKIADAYNGGANGQELKFKSFTNGLHYGGFFIHSNWGGSIRLGASNDGSANTNDYPTTYLNIATNAISVIGMQLNAGNTAVTGFVNASVSVNSAIIAAGANVYMNATSIFIGNSIANAVLTQTTLTVANSTAQVNVTPVSITTGTVTQNSAGHFVGSAFVANSTNLLTTGKGSFGTGALATAQLNVNAASAATIGVLIKAAASATANTLEIQNSSGGVLSAIDYAGHMGLNKAAVASNTILNISGGNNERVDTTATAYGINLTVINQLAGNIITASYIAESRYTSTGHSATGFQSGIIQNGTAGVMSRATGGFLSSPTVAAGTITTAYGLRVEAQKVTGVTTGYGISVEGATDNNYIAGALSIGGVVTAAANVNVTGSGSFTVSANVGANAYISTSTVYVGNSTVNTYINKDGLYLANSTSNTKILVPSAANYSATNVFLHANGSWVTVTGGGTPGGSNTFIQFNDSSAFNGTAGFIFDKTTNNVTVANNLFVGANVDITTSSVIIGNNNVNTTSNSSALYISSTTSNTLITEAGIKRSDASQNTEVRLSSASIGLYANSTRGVGVIPTTLKIGNTMTYSWSTVNDGTAGSQMQYMSANSTGIIITGGGTFINNTGITISGTVVNSTGIIAGAGQFTTSANVGANVSMDTSRLFVGNTTVNATSNSSGFYLANSTSNTRITVPTLAQYQSQTTYLASNGSWVDVKPTTFASGLMGMGIEPSQAFLIFCGDSKIQNLTQSGGFNTRIAELSRPGTPLGGPLVKAVFNANTGVTNATDYIAVTQNPFVNGDVVLYTTSTGNTALTGLSNNTSYYVISANSSALRLATTYGGSNINVTATLVSEIGHNLTATKGLRGWVTMGLSGQTLDNFVTAGTTGGWTGPSPGNADWNYKGTKTGAYSSTPTKVDDLIGFMSASLAPDIRPIVFLGHDYNDFGLTDVSTWDPAYRLDYMLTRLRTAVEKLHNARQNALIVLIIPHDCLPRPYAGVFPAGGVYTSFGSNLENDVALLEGWHSTWSTAKKQIAAEYGYCALWDWHRTAGYPNLRTANTVNYPYYVDNAHESYNGSNWLGDDLVQLLVGDNTKPLAGGLRRALAFNETNGTNIEEQYPRYCELRPDLYELVLDTNVYIGSTYMDVGIAFTTADTGKPTTATWADCVKFNPTIYMQIDDLDCQRITSYSAGALSTYTRLTGLTLTQTIKDAGDNRRLRVYVDRAQRYTLLGNSTVNAYSNSTGIFLANSTSNTKVTVPSAANYSATNVFLHANGSWVAVSGGGGSVGGSNTHMQFNDSGFANGSAGFVFDKTTNNVTVANNLFVGANVDITTSAVLIGNSTVNSTANSLGLYLANSTSNTRFTLPSAANYSATNVFLHANGSWVTVTGGGGGVAGSNTHIQFNDSGSANGIANLVFDKVAAKITVTNGSVTSTMEPGWGSFGGTTIAPSYILGAGNIYVGGGGVLGWQFGPWIQTNGDGGIRVGNTGGFGGSIYVGNSTVNTTMNTTSFAISGNPIGIGWPQNIQNASYTTVLTDAGKHIFNSSNNGTLAYTIANNTNVAYSLGTEIRIINGNTATMTIVAATGVTLQLGGGVTTGTRTVSNGGYAVCTKIRTDTWLVRGTGVT